MNSVSHTISVLTVCNIEKPMAKLPFNGILLADKPANMTSNHFLQQIKRHFNADKVGHGGTLDPMATGMLPILFGEATKFGGHLLEACKTYHFTCQLGQSTTTDDQEGEVIEHASIPTLSEHLLKNVFAKFMGMQTQIPPMYSALHHQGTRLHVLARQGITIERKPRDIRIDALNLVNHDATTFSAIVTCSKGTYIRVLAADIAKSLNSLGHLIYLRRLSVLPFTNEQMISIENILSTPQTTLQNLLYPIDFALQNLPKIHLSQSESLAILNGQRLSYQSTYQSGLCCLYHNNDFLGTAQLFSESGDLAPQRLVNIDRLGYNI